MDEASLLETRGTTRQRSTHVSETRTVQYPWHPRRDRCVFIDETIDRNGRIYVRRHVDETWHQRALRYRIGRRDNLHQD